MPPRARSAKRTPNRSLWLIKARWCSRRREFAASPSQDLWALIDRSSERFHNDSLYSLLKKLLIQAHAFRRAASSSNEFDDADFALLGICGDFATAGERFVAAEKVWNEREKENRQAAAAAAALAQVGDGDEVGSEVGKRKRGGKGERVWTDREYIKACEELAYGAVEIDSTKQCVFLSRFPSDSVG